MAEVWDRLNVAQRLISQAAAAVLLWILTYLSLYLWFAWLGDTVRDDFWYAYGQPWEYGGLAVTIIILSRCFAPILNRTLVIGTMSLSLIVAFYASTRGDVTGTSFVGIPFVAVVAPLFIAVALVRSNYRFQVLGEDDDEIRDPERYRR